MGSVHWLDAGSGEDCTLRGFGSPLGHSFSLIRAQFVTASFSPNLSRNITDSTGHVRPGDKRWSGRRVLRNP